MSDYFVDKCIKCKEEHSEDRNRIIIKMGRHWSELINDQDKYNLLCKWCYNTLDERGNNEYM